MSRRSILGGVLAASLLALAAPTGAGAISLPAGGTAVLSGTPDLRSLFATPAASATIASGQALDGAGTKVVFSSGSDSLFDGDDDNFQNVYVEDLASGAVQLVSRASGDPGEPAHTSCSGAVISDDGGSVAFVCNGALDPADTNDFQDVYVRDLVRHTTTLVSRANDGALGTGNASSPAIDAAGAFVAFRSAAPNLGATPGTAAVFRRDLAGGRTDFVSRPTDPASPGAPGAHPSISNDGRRVVFDTLSSLDAVDQSPQSDVYVRDFSGASPTTELVSRSDGAAGAVGNNGSQPGVISGDGNRVVFGSFATNLDPTAIDNPDSTDVFSRRLDTGRTVELNATSFMSPLSVSDDGVTSRMLLTGGGVILLAVDGSAPAKLDGLGTSRSSLAAISGNGSKVAMGAIGGATSDVMPELSSAIVEDLSATPPTTRTVSRPPGSAPFLNEGGDALHGSVSDDARYAAFSSTAPALSRSFGLVPGQEGIYRRDLTTGALTLVSRADGPTGAPLRMLAADNLFAETQISADGSRVAFVGYDLADNANHVFVRDIPSGRTFIADRVDGTDATDASESVASVTISDDGSRVAFSSSSRLVADDTDRALDVYVRDLAANRTFLVDRATGERGVKAHDGAFEAAISGDGRSVAFSALAGEITPGDDPDRSDIFVRRLDANTTTLVSVAGAATKGNDDSFTPSIDRDGNRVAFFSQATNFDPATGGEGIFVRDIAAGTLTVGSRADGVSGTADVSAQRFLSLSDDGQHLAFAAIPAGSIAPGDPSAPADRATRVYERDLADGTTQLISRSTGVAGAPAGRFDRIGQGALAITPDGSCVVFGASGHLLTPPGSADHVNLFIRAVNADCGVRVQPGPGGAAVLSRLAVKPARFHVGGRRGGTRVLFRLSRASSVTLAFDRLLAGHRKKGKRCSTRVHRGKRCTVARRVGRVTLKQSRLRRGANSVKFSGKLGRKALVPGRYRLTATPLHGTGRTVRFVVVKAPKRKHTSTKRKGR
jgi:Tol biopolymer transport system component